MDPIKEAFLRAKQDIQELKSQIELLVKEVESLKFSLKRSNNPTNQPTDRQTPQQTHNQWRSIISSSIPTDNPTQNTENPTNQHISPTDDSSYNNIPTDNHPLYSLKAPITHTSIGNQGVPTDRQTNQQTNRQTLNTTFIDDNKNIDKIENVSQLIDSLDSIKREVRFKFKKLTPQEMIVFATVYQLEESKEPIDYPLLSRKLNLSESSIRDYIQRIIKKGVPLIKSKENNKKIYLSISPDLKKIASLNTILQLREL